MCTLQELEVHLEEERRNAEDLRNQLTVSERRRVALGQELEDARSALEQVGHVTGILRGRELGSHSIT